MEVDYLIVGQGVSGSFLSWYLHTAGQNILVIDEDRPYSASKVASGVINPVTGRRIVTTWMIEELLPFALDAYTSLGALLHVPLIQQCSILDFHTTPQMENAFGKRSAEDDTYLHIINDETKWKQYFHFSYGIGAISNSMLIDVATLLREWRSWLKERDSLLEEKFTWSDCIVRDNHVSYKAITAKKIIFCEGAAGATNPYFNKLPYALDKGEVIIASIPGLPRSNIYKHGISIIPWKDDLFWIGSTYDWKYTDLQPTAAFRKKVEDVLCYWLRLPFTIRHHWASERPTNLERRPFVGLHPLYSALGILNGMGTKGCSLAPYFSWQLTQHLLYGSPIVPEADIARFPECSVQWETGNTFQ